MFRFFSLTHRLAIFFTMVAAAMVLGLGMLFLVGVSEFLCKRDGLQLTQIRSPNSMVNRFSAAFQSRIGMLHFWLMLRKAR